MNKQGSKLWYHRFGNGLELLVAKQIAGYNVEVFSTANGEFVTARQFQNWQQIRGFLHEVTRWQ